jgi:hypothetical protein
MMRRLVVAVAVLMAIMTATALLPRRAEAVDDLVYIIPAAVGGVVAVVLIVAILMADREDEPELGLTAARLPPLDERRDGVRLAPDCRPTGGGISLICW